MGSKGRDVERLEMSLQLVTAVITLLAAQGGQKGRGRTVMGLSTTCRTSRGLNPLQCIPTAPLFVLERRTRRYTETATHMPENIGTIACTVWQVQTPGVEVVVAQ